ncbi:predicted protein [Postia placenta Mad-698-R]|nr:predicted protein [Postia placenta Mad-698-R]
MSATLAHARLVSLVLSFAFGIVGMATGINALAKSNSSKSAVRRAASGLGATVNIDTHDVLSSGVVITVVCGLIALTSFFTLVHALLARFRWRVSAASSSADIGRHLRTVPLTGAHVLTFLTLWLFATLVPFTDFVANRQAKVTAYIGGVQLPPNLIQGTEAELGVTPVYHRLGYLRAGTVLPWIAFLFAVTSAALSYAYARSAASLIAGTNGYAAQPEVQEKEKVPEQVETQQSLVHHVGSPRLLITANESIAASSTGSRIHVALSYRDLRRAGIAYQYSFELLAVLPAPQSRAPHFTVSQSAWPPLREHLHYIRTIVVWLLYESVLQPCGNLLSLRAARQYCLQILEARSIKLWLGFRISIKCGPYALPLYEYVLTISQEVEHIWGNECGRASRALFSLNRFVMLLMAVGNALQRSVDHSYSLQDTFTRRTVVSALRVHALSVHNWYLSLPTLLLGLVPFITNTCNVIGVYYLARPIPTLVIPYCMALVPNHLVLGNSNNGIVIFSRTSIDLTRVYYLATIITHMLVGLSDSTGNLRSSRYYSETFSSTLTGQDNGALIQFILPMSSILVSRFLLNIHEAMHSSPYGESDRTVTVMSADILQSDTQTPALIFASQSCSEGGIIEDDGILMENGHIQEVVDDEAEIIDIEPADRRIRTL